MADPENPTSPNPEEPKTGEPKSVPAPKDSREGETAAASKAEVPAKPAKKAAKQKRNSQLPPRQQLQRIFRFLLITSRSQRSSKPKVAKTFTLALPMCFRLSTTRS
jgi:hypothetical protein